MSEETKPNKKDIHIYERDYYDMFPFKITYVFQRKGSISNTIESLVQEGYLELIPLVSPSVDPMTLAMVYRVPETTKVYLFMTDRITVSYLVHESIHLTSRLYEIINSEINENTEELFAYITQSIFNETIDIVQDKFKFKLRLKD